MDWFRETFRENSNLEHVEMLKIFFFVFKGLAAIGFLFVFGYVYATGGFEDTAVLIVILSSVVDLVPETVTIRVINSLPEKARKAEQLQLVLKAFAYILLLSAVTGFAPSPVPAYTSFMGVWLLSLLVEESVVFLTETG